VTERATEGSPLHLSPPQFARLTQLLDESLELTGPEREQWLTDLQHREPELAAVVRRVLSTGQNPAAAAFLSDNAVLARYLPAPGEAEPGLIGKQLGPYRVLSLLGHGGMGSVWRAERVDGLFSREVALKLVHPALMGRGMRERLGREREILGSLNHPHIAQLLDAGFADDGQPYLALEYVDGVPFTSYCDQHRLSIRERLELFGQVLSAVQYAHSNLVIHRDLKPSNILVTRDGRAQLLDFGIAKLLTEGVTQETALTQMGGRALTPDYAAPEQISGAPLSTAADVYALGVILYETLVGQRPYRLTRDSRGALEEAILNVEPVPPSRIPISEAAAAARATTRARLARSLKGDLDTIVMKALKKSSGERYPTADAFAEDTGRFLRGEIVLSQPDTLAYRVGKFARRNRAAVLTSLLVGTGLIATSAFALVQMLDARAQRDLAVSEAKRAEGVSDLTEFLVADSLKQVPQDAIRNRLARARELVVRRAHDNPLVAAQLLLVLAYRYIELGDDQTASELTRSSETMAHGLNNPELTGEVACLRTRYLVLAGDLAGARRQLAAGLDNMRHLQLVAPGVTADCADAQAFVAQANGDFAGAAGVLRQAVQSLERGGWSGSTPFISTSSNLARALVQAGQFREAWQVESRVLALVREIGRADSSTYYAIINMSCTILREGGRPRQAMALVDSAVAEARRTNTDFPSYLEGSRALAEVAAGGTEKAIATLTGASQAAREAGAHYWTLFQTGVVTAALDRGDVAGADAGWNLLAPVEEQMLAAGQRGVDVVQLLLLHARLDMEHHQAASAAKRLDRADALIASRHQPSNPDSRAAEILRARLLLESRQYQQAVHHASAAIQLARSAAVDPRSSVWVGEALLWRARAEAALGRPAVAAATAREALVHLAENVDGASPLIGAARALASGT